MDLCRACLLCVLVITCCAAEDRESSNNYRRQFWDSEGLASNAEASMQSEKKVVQSEVKTLIEELSSKSYYDDGVSRGRGRRGMPQLDVKSNTEQSSDVKENVPVAYKCCPVGQNLTRSKQDHPSSPTYSASLTGSGASSSFASYDGDPGSQGCVPSDLTFAPEFMEFNETAIWDLKANVWETFVTNPCIYDKYKLDQQENSEDTFYLLTNGSIIAPGHQPRLLNPGEYCLETFWTPDGPKTLPLVCFQTPPPKQEYSVIWMTFIATIMLFSVPLLVATSLMHFLVEGIKCAHSYALGNHTACLAIAYLSLSISQLFSPSVPNIMCTFGAFIIQGSFLACFLWLNVMCFDTYIYIKNPYNLGSQIEVASMEKNRFRYYSLYAWSLAVAWTVITAIFDHVPGVPFTFHKPNIGNTGCWFESDSSAFFFFYLPVAIILIANLVILVITALSRPRDANRSSDIQQVKLRKTIFRCRSLYVLMSLAWFLEVVSWWQNSNSFVWYISDFVNALQGAVVFFIFKMPSLLRKFYSHLQNKPPNGEELASIRANGITNGHPSTPV